MILETISVGPMEVNCYILASRRGAQAMIIDPGAESHKIKAALGRHNLSPAFVVNTHGHFDHIGADDSFGVPVYVHSQDLDFLKDAKVNLSAFFGLPYQVKSPIKELKDKARITLEDIELEVAYVPGHTPGGIALIMKKPDEKIVFTGDTLFCGGIGRSDLDGGNETLLVKSIKERLLILDEDTIVYPGHGPASTIGEEKRNNPFLS